MAVVTSLFHILLAISLIVALVGIITAGYIGVDSWLDLVAAGRIPGRDIKTANERATDIAVSSALSGGIAHVIGIFLALVGLTGPGLRPGREWAGLAVAVAYVTLQVTMLYMQIRVVHGRHILAQLSRNGGR